jgi:hypothetical protein
MGLPKIKIISKVKRRARQTDNYCPRKEIKINTIKDEGIANGSAG